MEDSQGKRFKGTSRHCQVGIVVGRAVSGNIVIAVELPGHTSVVNTTVCQTWCQTCGEVVVSCFPFCKLPFLSQLYFFLLER